MTRRSAPVRGGRRRLDAGHRLATAAVRAAPGRAGATDREQGSTHRRACAVEAYADGVRAHAEITGDGGDRLPVPGDAAKDHLVRGSQARELLFDALAWVSRVAAVEARRASLNISTPQLDRPATGVASSQQIDAEVAEHPTKPSERPLVVVDEAALLERPHVRGVQHVLRERPVSDSRFDEREELIPVAGEQRRSLLREPGFVTLASWRAQVDLHSITVLKDSHERESERPREQRSLRANRHRLLTTTTNDQRQERS